MTDTRAVHENLKMAVEKNKSLGQELGVENLQRLYAERALLKREKELLMETEDGLISHFGDFGLMSRDETRRRGSGETEK